MDGLGLFEDSLDQMYAKNEIQYADMKTASRMYAKNRIQYAGMKTANRMYIKSRIQSAGMQVHGMDAQSQIILF